MSNITLMSDVFRSSDLFLSSIENLNFNIKANLDILDILYQISNDYLQKQYEVKIQE
jgi:hypothetical protein